MLEALCALLSVCFEVLLALLEPLAELFIFILQMDTSMGSSSILGEPRLAKEGRRFWRNVFVAVLLVILVVGTVSPLWWCRP